MRKLRLVPVALLLFGVIVLASYWPIPRADVAGWFQALGGLLAIWGAFEVGAAQTLAVERAREQAREDAQAQIRRVVDEISSLVTAHIAFVRNWPSGTGLKVPPETLVEALPAIDSCLALPMPENCSQALLEVRSACTGVISLLRNQADALVHGHSRVSMALDLADIKCEFARKRVSAPDPEERDRAYFDELRVRNATLAAALADALSKPIQGGK